MKTLRQFASRGFTLAEMMLTLGLVALLYTLISGVLIQVSRYVRDGREVARNRHELLSSVEEIRYQMRSLYYPTETVGLEGMRTAVDGRDVLKLLTTNGREHKGVVEVTYRIDNYEDPDDPARSGPALYYREFPFHRRRLRTLDPNQEAEWQLYLRDVGAFELEYSTAGTVWQKEWDGLTPPGRIRVRIERVGKSHDKLSFDVTPGVGAGRW